MTIQTYDYIVVGGGSAGCVMASRLSEDPNVRVCLLEAGKPDTSMIVQAPAGVVAMLPTKIKNWAFETVPQQGLNGRRGYQPRGKTLGGSSSTNGMMYARGHRWDYDHWGELGNEGWTYDECLPYFIRSENNESIENDYHGKGGPLNVTTLRSPSSLVKTFIQAAEHIGVPYNPDVNGEEQFGVMYTQVTQINGERCSAAKAYLTPHLNRPNLTVITSATTMRILFENKQAVGVEYRHQGQNKQVKAELEVLLCAGAFGSPQILMLSGVGAKSELDKHGIKLVHDLPGVGENLQDHIDVVHSYCCASDVDTFGVSLRGGYTLAKAVPEWKNKRTGKITSNYVEGIAFLKSEEDLEIPDLEFVFVVGMLDDHCRKMHLGHGYSSHVTLLRPKSRGTVHLASKDPFATPLIDPNFFGEQEDLDSMVKGWRIQKKMLEAPAFDSVRGHELYPVDADDTEAVIQDLRNRADTHYHPVGSCKMGPDSDPMAVVDAQLRVKGLSGLRVIDASIMPTLVGANTNAPTIMIAEKTADEMRKAISKNKPQSMVPNCKSSSNIAQRS